MSRVRRTRAPRPRLRLRDLVAEAFRSLAQRPLRTALTAAGTAVGVGSFVATLGLATTTGSQLTGRFDLLQATEVTARASVDADGRWPFPADADERARRLDGAVAAGQLWSVPLDGVTTATMWDPPPERSASLDVTAVTPGAFTALGAHVTAGRLFDAFHERRAEAVAVLGVAAARELGLRVAAAPGATVVVGRVPLTVLGIVSGVARRPDLLRAVVVPAGTARRLWPPQPGLAVTLLTAVRPGAAQVVGDELALALRPDRQDLVAVAAPPDPRGLRRGVESDVTGLITALALVSLLVGAFGIANTTLVSVLERVREIGIRRAVGATPRAIAGQFLTESALIGAFGGAVGACLGIVAATAVARANGWTLVLDPRYVLPAPAIGTATGLLAGLYPSLKAAMIEPVDALRG